MTHPETDPDRAERRVARQPAVIGEPDRDNHPPAATWGREVPKTRRRSLELARAHLRIERQGRGLPP
ncbi:hypothetical protein JYK14_24845 [Siccirubricoccus sp. KC 17139]|uniref:Uncharacterized protein n=1 Tax=Siccirubricoccus soli TaxID=2899147 RepID=A0ABT1DBQ6_9PROT|nr:hypothetical protein [Siccirubricoccus soli]MCO6419364.1 hypothetical protein [Siccirubricoccus soli]MCP2685499.1 hypothetical protein [Siccirubricoccus soli]